MACSRQHLLIDGSINPRMRLAIDMQGALTNGSRPRGIGRYTSSLVHAMAQQRGERELRLMLNANFPTPCCGITLEFEGRLPAEAISLYNTPLSEERYSALSSPRRQIADAILRRHVAGLQPDCVLFTSLFESAPEDFIPLNLRRYPAVTAAIVYDLIPAIFPDFYLHDTPSRSWFLSVLEILKTANLLLAISESARRDAIAWLDLQPARIVNISAAAHAQFRPLGLSEQQKAATAHGLGLVRPFIMYVSGPDPRKNLKGALAAFAALAPELRCEHQLLLVTRLSPQEKATLQAYAQRLGIEHDGLVISELVNDDELVRLLNSCRAFIFPSLYEGFGLPVLEAMQCGTPVLAANNSSIPEIVDRRDILFEASSAESAAQVMGRVLVEEPLRRDLADWGIRRARHFSWERTACLALEAMEATSADGGERGHVMGCELLDLDGARAEVVDALAPRPECTNEIENVVDFLLQSVPAFRPRATRRLLIDVTDTSQSGRWTGIQRVVRQLTAAFYRRGFEDKVVPVAVRLETKGALSVPPFVAEILGHTQHARSFPIECWEGDDLFMLDSNWIRYPDYARIYDKVRRRGGRTITCIYDLIPELHPEFCDAGMPPVHEQWLRSAVATSDALLCISRSTAVELITYIERNKLPHCAGLKIGWFHCGSEIVQTHDDQDPSVAALRSFVRGQPTFVMVGTLEPRKNHADALDAFERLWARNAEIALCLVGRRGWNIDALERRILSHPELGRRLHWLSEASDTDLVYAYRHAEAVLCLSLAEGFGLPIAEAARMARPVICSDIPVFREVGGEGAVYVPPNDPQALVAVLEAWLLGERRADPALISCLSWAEAAARIHRVLYGNEWYATLY
jgi:glycosyltransferase involved in cell wall biosynthesis